MKQWRSETCFIRRTRERVLKPQQQQQQHKIEEKSYFQRGQFSLCLPLTSNKVYARSRLNCGWMIWKEIYISGAHSFLCMYCGQRVTIYNKNLNHASMKTWCMGYKTRSLRDARVEWEKKFIKIMDILIAVILLHPLTNRRS